MSFDINEYIAEYRKDVRIKHGVYLLRLQEKHKPFPSLPFRPRKRSKIVKFDGFDFSEAHFPNLSIFNDNEHVQKPQPQALVNLVLTQPKVKATTSTAQSQTETDKQLLSDSLLNEEPESFESLIPPPSEYMDIVPPPSENILQDLELQNEPLPPNPQENAILGDTEIDLNLPPPPNFPPPPPPPEPPAQISSALFRTPTSFRPGIPQQRLLFGDTDRDISPPPPPKPSTTFSNLLNALQPLPPPPSLDLLTTPPPVDREYGPTNQSNMANQIYALTDRDLQEGRKRLRSLPPPDLNPQPLNLTDSIKQKISQQNLGLKSANKRPRAPPMEEPQTPWDALKNELIQKVAQRGLATGSGIRQGLEAMLPTFEKQYRAWLADKICDVIAEHQ